MSQEEKIEDIEMEEELEEETLNQEEKTFTLAEVEAMKRELASNSERGVQKVLNEKKAYEKAMSSLNAISDDESKLIDLYNENAEAGKIILNTYYGGKTLEEFKQSINYKIDYNDPKTIEKLIEDKVTAREIEKLQAETNKAILNEKEQFIKDLKMSGEELEKFEEEFEDRKNLKSFSLKTLKSHLEKAYSDANPDKFGEKIRENQEIANSIGTSGKGTGKKSNNKEETNPFDEIFDKYKTN